MGLFGLSMGSLGVNSKLWRCIWHSEASATCKSIVWRACNEELPVKSLLVERGILGDATCPCCGNSNETITHAFLLCEEVKRIWFASPLSLRVESHNVTNLSHWIEQGAKILDNKEMGMVIAIIWTLWQKRNAWIFEHKKLDCTQVIEKARSMMILEDQVAGSHDEWRPPSGPYIKANFSAFVKDNSGTGMGVIFRNSSGTTIASGTKFLDDECFEDVIAEALSYNWAVEQSGEIGLSNVIFETDCQELHTQWSQVLKGKNSVSNCYLESLVQDCKFMIQGTGSSLKLVRPTANRVAHCLAMVASDYGERIWMEFVPEEASFDLQSDVKGIANLSKAMANLYADHIHI